MDLNIRLLNSNQENQLLLDAVRNKFDQNATEGASFSPPKFNIPILKIPGESLGNTNIDRKNANTQSTQSANSDTQLNQFLLKQLKENRTHNPLSQKGTGFVMPELKSFPYNSNKGIVEFTLPALQTQSTGTSMGSLANAINNLKVQEDKVKPITLTSATIDLTTALATKFETHQGTPPTRDLVKRHHYDELDFEIPFIDCDRLDTSRKQKSLLRTSNEYCITDVSQMLLQHSLTEPSVIGRFLSAGNKKYLDPLPLNYLASKIPQQKAKHRIEAFNFDTKSPDDIVQLALSQNHRRHYN